MNRPALAALVLAPLLAVPGAALASPAHASTVGCTKTKSGTCIRGGETCPKASNGKRGTDAKGRVYVCKAGHWRVK